MTNAYQPVCRAASKMLFEALVAQDASNMIPPERQIFSPFIGAWDLVVRWFDPSGQIAREENGEWLFSWVLEGRGVQDVWIVPPRRERGTGKLYEYGTSIRFYDPVIDAWRSTWIGPMHQMIRSFVARRIGAAVVLESEFGDAPKIRWTFANITEASFTWTNEVECLDGWRVQQSFDAQRRSEIR